MNSLRHGLGSGAGRVSTPIRRALIVSEIGWGFLRQRHHHLAAALAAKGVAVEFLQGVPARTPPLGDLLRRVVGRLRSRGGPAALNPVPHGVRLTRSPFLPHTNPLFRGWNTLVARRIAAAMPRPDLVYIFSNNPSIPEAFRRLDRPPVIVQDVIHNWWAFPWSTQAQRSNIRRSLAAADLLVSDSPLTLRRAEEDAPGKPTHLMLPAAGPEWHAPGGPASEPLPGASPRPAGSIRAVFFGNLRGNSDLGLLNDLAALPCVSLSGYGVLDLTALSQASPAVRAAMQPAVDPATLARHVAQADVVVLPYANDAFSQTISPAKYFECLASGAMVVSRAALRHLPGWDDFVHLLEPTGTRLSRLQDMLVSHAARREDQMRFARQHTWERRFESLIARIEELRT